MKKQEEVREEAIAQEAASKNEEINMAIYNKCNNEFRARIQCIFMSQNFDKLDIVHRGGEIKELSDEEHIKEMFF